MSYFDDASLAFLPSGAAGKDGKAYSIKPTDGDGDFDFSRGSNLAATRINSDGLIEKGRENLLLQSNQFDATWTLGRATLTSGQSGYDGTSNAWKLKENTSTGTHEVIQSLSVSSGIYTYSTKVLAGTRTKIALVLAGTAFNTGGNGVAIFNLADGTLLSSSGDVIDTKIINLGGGWYNVSITKASTSTIAVAVIQLIDASNNTSYTGDGTSYAYIQSSQLEIGLVATDYITSGATTGKAGILENTPRFNYGDGASCPSLLLEPSRTNLVTQSEYFGDSSWNDGGNVISDNSTTSPDGYVNASSLTPSATTGALRLYYTVTSTAAEYTWSVYAKANGNQFIQLLFGSALNSSVYSNFDLTNGTITQGSGGKIESVGSGWYRISISATLAAATNQLYVWNIDNGTSARGATSTGNGVDGTHLWGASLELGSYPTSYIPTYGIIETRAADATSGLFSGKNIFDTSWTAFCELVVPYQGSAGVGAGFAARAVEGSTSTTYWNFALAHGNGELVLNTYSPSTTVSIAYNFGDKIKIAVRSDGNYFVNGIKYAIAGMITAEPVELGFGRLGNSGFSSGETAKINQTLVFPTALTDAECIALTTI